MSPHLTVETIKARVIVNPETGCWNWTGPLNAHGYGQVTYRYANGKRRTYRTHRLVFESAHGRSVYPGLCICHSCDNPRCNNPEHLFEDSFKGNYDDMVAKGRMPEGLSSLGGQAATRRHWFGGDPGKDMAGEASPRAKLTLAQVRELRARWTKGGVTKAALARAYGISHSNCRSILSGNSWKDDG